MVDDFDRAANILEKRQSPEYIVGTIPIMTEAAKRGEMVVFKAWPGFTWWSDKELMSKPHADQYALAVKNLDFPLACFLIGAEKHCYFSYSWGWLPEHGALDSFPEFEKPLGPPKGPARQEGWIFRREFAHASAFVDVEQRVGKITWKLFTHERQENTPMWWGDRCDEVCVCPRVIKTHYYRLKANCHWDATVSMDCAE